MVGERRVDDKLLVVQRVIHPTQTWSSITIDQLMDKIWDLMEGISPSIDENLCRVMIALTQSVMDYITDERIVNDYDSIEISIEFSPLWVYGPSV